MKGPLIEYAVKDGKLVHLSVLKRGEPNLTCPTCGDRLVVKNGKGKFSADKTRPSSGRKKHLSHTAHSRCHGEGPAHYRLKMAIAERITKEMLTPKELRGNRTSTINYRCPDPEYGPREYFKYAPMSANRNLNQATFTEMEHGFHEYCLMTATEWITAPLNPPERLHTVSTEANIGKGKTRADIAGYDRQGNLLWVIEIKRTNISSKALANAEQAGYPLFIIDIGNLPKTTAANPYAEVESPVFRTMMENLRRNGSIPQASATRNLECSRKSYGMGPQDHSWTKEYALVCYSLPSCGEKGCPDCREILLHECGSTAKDGYQPCHDTWYMMNNGITSWEMYRNPKHRQYRHP